MKRLQNLFSIIFFLVIIWYLLKGIFIFFVPIVILYVISQIIFKIFDATWWEKQKNHPEKQEKKRRKDGVTDDPTIFDVDYEEEQK
ncbi:hypothetical protein FJ366_04215 [Candidatus Dependentiae bacterium]|nr:hypothetical protein [Candidatus Dependentiae bacterium]